MSSLSVRALIWVPILHTEVDLGAMRNSVRQVHVQKGGVLQWEQRSRAVEHFWKDIRDVIESMELPGDRLRLYQDGLPNCGREVEIVRHLAEAGSPNHQILLSLVAKGAKLTGTEDPQLLLKEYELIRESLACPTSDAAPQVAQRRREQSKEILQKRDRYIAQRIDETLADGEIGLIFLGMLHSLDDLLPSDIHVRRLGGEFLRAIQEHDDDRTSDLGGQDE